jgi:hypothetical protein
LTGAPGGCDFKSSCRSLRKVLASSIGTGSCRVRRKDAASWLRPFSRVSSSCNSCAAKARACNRAHNCSSMRLSTNASGSSRTRGNSNSSASSKIRGGSHGTSVRSPSPQAFLCSLGPTCPRRSLKSTSGNAARSRNLRIPQLWKIGKQNIHGQTAQ